MAIIYEEECYRIIGACMEVHRTLGCGFLEAVYPEALAIELMARGIPFEQEKILEISYKGVLLKKKYAADFVCYSSIILEAKATSGLIPKDESQVLNYLNATGKRLGLLVNFGEPSLKYKRLVV